MIKQLESKPARDKKFAISYIDRNEAIFVLGLLKPIPCTHCPDYYKGCRDSVTLQESAMMSESDYIDKHVMGTEQFLCGKLRNIITLSKAEEQDLCNKFEIDFNSRVSLLTKKGNDDKYVLINDKDEFNLILKNMERQMVDKIQNDVEKINQHNSSIVHEMQEQIEIQSQTIKEMQSTIKKLKRRTKNDVV
jgi:hypothetical protein